MKLSKKKKKTHGGQLMCACLLLRSREEVCQAFEDQCGRNPIRPKKREEALAFNFHLCPHTHTHACARTHTQVNRAGCINMRVGLHKPITAGGGATVLRRHPSDADASSRPLEKLIIFAAPAVIEGGGKDRKGKRHLASPFYLSALRFCLDEN